MAIPLNFFRKNKKFLFDHMTHSIRGVATRGPGGAWPPTSISKPKEVQQFQFQTSEILLFTVFQKLYGPEISRFLPCMLQVLDSLRQLFIFSNYIGETDHFTLDLLKRSDTYRLTF